MMRFYINDGKMSKSVEQSQKFGLISAKNDVHRLDIF